MLPPKVSISGYSLRAPKCSSVPEFAKALREGRDLTTGSTRYPTNHLGLPPRQGRIKDEDIASFDPAFFRMSHKQAEAMDPLIRMLLQVSYESLLDAKIDVESLRGSRTGVYVGHCFSDVSSHTTSSFQGKKTGYELVNGANSMAANRLSYFYDFKGPSLTIDTACSSSLIALHYAMRDLQSGTVDHALVAGLSLTLNPHKNASFNAFSMLSPMGHCYAFDTRADGYCRSDGVACIVLTWGEEGYALVAGTGTNSDGAKTEGITYPSAQQQAKLMTEVLSMSSVSPEEISFHEAHGTGTIAGDQEELAGLSEIYHHPIYVGPVKSNMGHAEGASGLMGLIKLLLMFEEKTMYPNFDFQESPHDAMKNGSFTVLSEAKDWLPAPSSIACFGFGGSNAFATLMPTASKLGAPTGLASGFPFAASRDANVPLNSKSDNFFSVQRSIGNQRAFPFALKGKEWVEYSSLVFVLDGQGSQWIGMGKDLMEDSIAFRTTMEKLEKGTGVPLVQLYEDGSKWMSKEYSAVGIVSFQLGLLAVLKEAGIHPDLFLGHSLGELACSYLAGLASEVDVLRFAMVRTELVALIDPDTRLDIYAQEPSDGCDYFIDDLHHDQGLFPLDHDLKINGHQKQGRLFVKRAKKDAPKQGDAISSFKLDGLMAVVGCAASSIESTIKDLGLTETRVACHNAPSGQTISGPKSEMQTLLGRLRSDMPSVFIREIDTDSIAYHAVYLKCSENGYATSLGFCQLPKYRHRGSPQVGALSLG